MTPAAASTDDAASPPSPARQHAARVRTLLEALARELHEDLRDIDDPRAQAMFETAAEVLDGLHAAFDRYARGADVVLRA